jgi:hypothetical protein
VSKRIVQGFLGGWGDRIKVFGYECTRPLAICYISRSRFPDPGVGQQLGRTGYNQTDEVAEGMEKHDFSVFEYHREFVAAGIASNLKIEVQR